MSFLSYGFLGFLWLLYDLQFSFAVSPQAPLVLATKIQTIVFLSVLGALGTSLVIYFLERKH
jgi:hypothetical protein